MPQGPRTSLDDEISSFLTSVQSSPAQASAPDLDSEIGSYLNSLNQPEIPGLRTAPAVPSTPFLTPPAAPQPGPTYAALEQGLKDGTIPKPPTPQPLPVQPHMGPTPTAQRIPGGALPSGQLPTPQPAPAPAVGIRSRTGQMYEPTPAGQSIFDAPLNLEKQAGTQIAQGAQQFAAATRDATAGPPQMGGPVQAGPYQPVPRDQRFFSGAADVVEGAMAGATPLLLPAAAAAPLTTGAALAGGYVADRTAEAAAHALGASDQEARLIGDVSGAIAAGVPITEAIRAGGEWGRARVAASDAAADTASRIQPEPTDIPVVPERPQLAAENPLGSPPPAGPLPEPPVAARPGGVAVAPESTPAPAPSPAGEAAIQGVAPDISGSPQGADLSLTQEIAGYLDTLDPRVGTPATDATAGNSAEIPPEIGGYAGPERRGAEREATPEADTLYNSMREKLARGEPTGSTQAREDFAERQRVEQARNEAAPEPPRDAYTETTGVTVGGEEPRTLPNESAPSLDDEIRAHLDTLDTGEQQGRLPGAEGARQAGKADTTFKAPQQASGSDFSLEQPETPEAKARRGAAERGPDLFGEGVESDHARRPEPGRPAPHAPREDAEGRGVVREGARARPESARLDPIARAAEERYPAVASDARANGFHGTDEQLHAAYQDRVRAARELIDDLGAIRDEHSPTALITAIKGYGGLKPFDTDHQIGARGKKLRGDFESIVEGFGSTSGRNQRGASAPFRNDGLSLDRMLESLHQGGRWSHLENTNNLLDALDHAARDPHDQGFDLPDIHRALDVALDTPEWWNDDSFDPEQLEAKPADTPVTTKAPAKKSAAEMTDEELAADIMADVDAERSGEDRPVTTEAPHTSTFKVGERVMADEGMGALHAFDGASRNVKIALEPNGRLTKWIPADRVTPVPFTAGEAETMRRKLRSLTNQLSAKDLSQDRYNAIVTDIAAIEDKLMKVDGLPDDYQLVRRVVTPPVGSPDARSVLGGGSRTGPAQKVKRTPLTKYVERNNPTPVTLPADTAKAKNKAERDAAIAELRARRAKRESGPDRNGPSRAAVRPPALGERPAPAAVDPGDVVLMVKIVRSYLADGITDFATVAQQFQADYGAGARELDRHLEIGWRKLRDEDVRVADVLVQAHNEPEGATDADADLVAEPGDSDAVESAGGPGARGAPGVAGEQPTAEGGVSAQPGQRGKRRAPRRADSDRTGIGAARPGDESGSGAGASAPGNVDTASGVDDPDVAAAHARGEAPRHYVITGNEQLTTGGWVSKLDANMDALKLLKSLQAEGRMASADEQAVLARYIGWGHTNLAPIVDPRGIAERRDPRQKQARQELEQLLSADELRELGESIANAHYSFHDLPRAMWDLVERLGFKGGSVLEPAVGSGHFFGTMPEHLRGPRTRLFGVDKEPIASAIARQLYQGASIQTSPLQEAKLPENYFDLAISNVPFGKIEIFDPAFVSAERKPMTKSIHNYYFAKALDVVRPGGIVAFITSAKTLDAKSDTIRRYLAERAKLLGAIRLTDSAFGKTAGTEVVADMIVLQKYGPGVERRPANWLDVVNRPELNEAARNGGHAYFEKNDVVWTNEYWTQHPEMVLGTENRTGKMNNAPFQYNVQGDVTAEKLAAAVARFEPNVYTVSKTPPRKLASAEVSDSKQGTFVIEKGKVYTHDKSTLVPVDYTGKDLDRVKLFVPLRDAYGAVLDVMNARGSDADLKRAQAGLKKSYDAFVKAHGLVNLPANRRVIEADPNAGRIVALEDVIPVKTGKGTQTSYELRGLADIFTKRTVEPVVEPTRAGSPQDALVQSLAWKGGVDLDYMAGLTGQPPSTLIASLPGEIYHAPGADEKAYVAAEEYLSGDVVTKLAQAEAAASTEPRFEANVAALKAVQPKKLESHEFDAPFGATWVPAEMYQQFLRDTSRNDYPTVRLINHEQKTYYYVENAGGANHEFKPDGIEFQKWAEAALNGRLPNVEVKTKEGTYVDQEATDALRESLAQLREQWANWWQDNPGIASKLTDIYNAMFNREVARQFDGSRIVLPNASPDIKLRPWQKNVVWRVLQSGNTLIAHAVGAGKTFAMIGAAAEMKRLGLARKPTVVVPNHLIEQWRRDFLRMYPSARVLVPTKKDFEKANRARLIARIANNDWDAVVMAQSQFLRVAVSTDTLKAFINEQEQLLLAEGAEQMSLSIDEFDQLVTNYGANDKTAIKLLSGRNVERSAKDIVRQILRLRARLQKRLDQQKKDSPVEFEQLGIDALLVDEAHLFKNLYFSTGLNGIVGLKGSDSDRALDMYLKVRMTNRASGNRNVVFATGTPVANTMSELYTMFRYLAQDQLDRLGMGGFDAWKSAYAVAVAQSEPAPEGGYKERTRLRDWMNLKQLSELFRRFTDVVTTDDLKAAVVDGKPVLELPKLKGGGPTVVALEPHPNMGEFMSEIAVRIEELRTGKVNPKDDNHLKISTEASLAAIDMRLVNPHAKDDPNSRVNVAAREIASRYKATAKDKLTQLVFLDVGVTPAKQMPPLPASVTGGPVSPKATAADVADEATEDAEDEKAGDIVTEEAAHEAAMASVTRFMHGRDLYGDLVNKLVAKGVKRDDIAFIHQATTAYEQGRLFEAMNEGRIRVLVATTGKGGVGMNVQKRLMALHHLDVPWRPADMEQREGRILRQGNENPEVEIVRYVTKKSFDEYRWGVLAAKQGFIGQLLKGEVSKGADEDTTLVDMEVASALASGDPRALKAVNLERELKGLRARKAAFERKRQNTVREIAQRESMIARHEAYLATARPKLEAAQAFAEKPEIVVTHAPSNYGYGLTQLLDPKRLDMSTPEGREAFQAHVVKMMDSRIFEAGKFADAGPFELWVAPQTEDKYEGGELIRQTTGGVVSVTLPVEKGGKEGELVGSSPNWNPEKPPAYAQSAMAYLKPDRISGFVDRSENIIANNRRWNDEDKPILEKPFADEAALQAKEAELDALREGRNADLSASAAEKKAAAPPPESEPPISKAAGGRPPSLPNPAGTPITPSSGMRPSEILKGLKKGLHDLPISTGNFRERAHGIFKADVHSVRTRIANDLPVAFHEIGHYLDRVLLDINHKDPKWRDELKQLGQATSMPSYSVKEQRREGAAEFFREFLIDPKFARTLAPNYAAEFEARLAEHPEEAAVVAQAQERIAGYLAQDLATRGAMRVDFTGASPKPTWEDRFHTLLTKTIDDLDPIRNAVQSMRDGRPLDYSQDAYVLARNARGSAAVAEAFLSHGPRGRSGQFLGPSLKDAISPVREHLEAFQSYLVALRTVELLTGPERAKRGRLLDYVGMSLDEANAVIAKTQSRKDVADFERAKENVYAYQDGMLEYLRQSHALNDDQIKAMKLLNQNYVPFKRVRESGAGGPGARRGYANQRTPISRIHASNEDIVAPLESIIGNTFRFVSMAERNKVALALTRQAATAAGSAKWLEKVEQTKVTKVGTKRILDTMNTPNPLGDSARDVLEQAGFDVDQLLTLFDEKAEPNAGKQQITVVRHGVPEVWEVHDKPLYDALLAVGPQNASALVDLMSKPVQLLRAGATLTPGFIARNPTRDTLVAYMQSRYGFLPGYDTLRGLVSLVTNDENAKLFHTSGVQQAALVGADVDRRRAQRAIAEMSAGSRAAHFRAIVTSPTDLMRALVAGPFHALQHVSGLMEEATRLGEFRLALNAGGQERGLIARLTQGNRRAVNQEALTKATLAARDVTTDFSRGGSLSKEANRVYAFFNARVQGYVRLYEAFQHDPSGVGSKIGLLVLLSIALWTLNDDDDHYANVPDWEKNSYWHIPVGPGAWAKLAKPFEWGWLPNLVEASLDDIKRNKDGDAHAREAYNRIRPFDRETATNLIAALLPTAILPLAEAGFNYDSFRHAYIVSPWDEKADPELQYSDWTTDTAKGLGKIMGVSPAKIDHIIFGYAAGAGRGVVEGVSDPVARLLSGTAGKNAPTAKLRALPLVGTFAREKSFDASSQDIQDFYDEYEEMQRFEDSMGRYIKAGAIDRATARKTSVEHERFYENAGKLKAAAKEMKQLRPAIKAIYDAPPDKMDPATKRAQLDRVYEQLVQIARFGLGRPPLKVAVGQ